MKRILGLSVLAIAVLSLAACGKKGGTTTGTQEMKAGAPKMEFYIMSQCPFGGQVINGIAPALEKLPGYVNLQIDYIGNVKPDGSFSSMHGQAEVDGDIVQLCALKQDFSKGFKFIQCQFKNSRAVPGNWEECSKEAALDAAALKSCKDGQEGKDLLKASFAKAEARAARGSPTMFLADQPYKGGRGGNDFIRAICEKLTDKPAGCDIPPPPKVNVIAITDKRCSDRACQSFGRMTGHIKSVFTGAEIKELDYATDEGKQVFTDSGLKLLPAVLFDESVEKDTDGFQKMSRYLTPAGKYKSLAVGAQFDPSAEICDNKQDDTGNGKIDCDDPTCDGNLVCRKEIPGRLDVFVMSQCPYGVKALDAMDEVLKNFEGGMSFNVNFIADEQGDGFRALHGQPEVDENIRELCAITHYGKNNKYMEYILCRNKNIKSADWKPCAVGGIDANVIEKCFAGDEGKQLLRDNIKIAKSLSIGGSPTWLANNKYQFSGIDAETVRQNFCKYNAGMKNCDKTLSGQPKGGAVPAGACGQ